MNARKLGAAHEDGKLLWPVRTPERRPAR
jgi:hypothetical protein